MSLKAVASNGGGGGGGTIEEITSNGGSIVITNPNGPITNIEAASGGSGTVTKVSVTTANGVSGSVANDTTTPAISLTLGAITPSTVNALTLAAQSVGFTVAGGTMSKTLTVSGNATVSGTNTGDTPSGGVQYDVQLNDGSGGFSGSNDLNFQGGYLTINGDSGYGQLQFLNTPASAGYGGAGINGTATPIITGAANGDLSIWATQAINLSADSGATNMLQLNTDGTINIPTLTASELLALDGSKDIQTLTTATYPSLTELSYVKGVTSSIQTQIDAKGSGTVTGATDSTLTLTGTTLGLNLSNANTWAAVQKFSNGTSSAPGIAFASNVVGFYESTSNGIGMTLTAGGSQTIGFMGGGSTIDINASQPTRYYTGSNIVMRNQLQVGTSNEVGASTIPLIVQGTTAQSVDLQNWNDSIGTVLAKVNSAGGISGSSVNGIVLSGSSTPTLAITGTTTVSGANTGDQNLFKTIAVSGQSDVVADTTTDTLTLVAGTNVTITTDASTDSITINSSGGGGGSGTVTKVSVATANGFSGTVANDTTTPAITIVAGAIVPTSVNSVVLSGASTPTLAVTGTTTVSGTNTGDQTTSNSDSTITVATGTTNPVVSLNLSNANSWSGAQNFTAGALGSAINLYGASPQIIVGAGSSTNGAIAFNNSTNNNALILQSGATGSALTFTLPIADGTNGQSMVTNGSGVLSFASAGGGGSALTDAVAQTAHGLAVKDVIRLSGTSTYAKAQANSAANAEVIGIVSAVADVNNFTVTTSGYISGLSSLTANTVYFLSASSAGALTATEPSALGQVSKPVFVADTTTSGYLINYRGDIITNNVVSVNGRVTAQTAAASSILAYTVGASDASFYVSGNVNVTSSTLNSFTMTVAYTDETNASRTLTLTFSNVSGTLLTTITNALGVGAYEGVPLQIRCKAATTITFATVGTFTTVTYNAEAHLQQVA